MAKHGRYKIVRRVADGGMAEIFLATQIGREGFQKPVILKQIHSTIYADPQFRNMFIDEAHISMSLSHSNIVQILDLGVGAGRYFLVLELVDGWDLGRVLQRAAAAGTPLPRELGLYIAADVCRALAYAHGKADGNRPLGIVHRDVSPHNILLSEQGEVKLADFGIAKAMNKREQTGTGVVKGKVAFMSPEQAMGKAIDARSDLFSLGTIIYLLMTRSRPFEAATELETLLRVQKGDFTPAETTAPDLEPEVAAIIARAMRLDPADRYQSADEMLGDLERALRTVFQPVGQTELKRWLAQLAATDGVPSIGRAPERPTATRGGELDGDDVVSLDSENLAAEIDGEEATSLAMVQGAGGGRARVSRARPTNLLPVPNDAEGALEGRGRQAELALPVPEGDERPGRRRARRGNGFSILLFFGAVVVGGAWAAGKYARLWSDGKTDEPGGGIAKPGGSSGAATDDKPAVSKPVGSKSAAEKTAGDKERSRRAVAAGDAGPSKANDAPETEATAQHRGGELESTRDQVPRRSHPGDKQKDDIRHGSRHRSRPGSIDLKDMMAPDPSLLPAAPAPAPAPTPETP